MIVFPTFDRAYRTNEHQLLDQLAMPSTGCASSDVEAGASVMRRPQYDVYRIEHACKRAPATASDN